MTGYLVSWDWILELLPSIAIETFLLQRCSHIVSLLNVKPVIGMGVKLAYR